VPAPAAIDLDYVLGDDFLVFDTQLTTDREVMESASFTVSDHVEPGQVPAGGASVTGRRHEVTLPANLAQRGRVHPGTPLPVPYPRE
jgi:hypothetical protein